MRKKYSLTTTIILAFILALSGCKNADIIKDTYSESDIGIISQPANGRKSAPKKLMTSVKDLQEKHASTTLYEYTDPMYNLPRDYEFVYECAPAYVDATAGGFHKDFAVYLDSDFGDYTLYKMKLDTDIKRTDKGAAGTLTLRPGYSPALHVLSRDGTELYTDWGNAPKYWLVQYRDTQTGEWYDRPVVTVFTLKNELDAPTVHFGITEKGSAFLEWEPISGADSYIVYQLSFNGEIGFGNSSALLQKAGETNGTSYDALNRMPYVGSGYSDTMNWLFYNESDSSYRYALCVVAVNGESKSAISNLIFTDEYDSRLPYVTEECYDREKSMSNAQFAGVQDTRISPLRFDSALNLPSHVSVIMCDDRVIPKPVDYGTATYEKPSRKDTLELTVSVIGTELTETLWLELSDGSKDAEEEYLQNLSYLTERQEQVQAKAADITPRNRISYTPPKDLTADSSDSAIQAKNIGAIATISEREVNNELSVYANSALSEYIAMNMLMGYERIDVSMFKEAYDADYLVNSIAEAYRQNPLIGSINDLEFDYAKGQLILDYDLTSDEIISMQTTVIAEVSKVITQIISDGMTDLEKEIAINEYLCSSAEYDYAALKNAEKYNFRRVDKKFIHSFTPYGVLISKKGVCASYAGAFKLLAEAAGLDAIVVTGYLDGCLPHAWNRVYVDGYWMTVDATNNASQIKNALFNVPDRIASGILTEDNNYVYKPFLATVNGSTEEYELYRIENNYFPLKNLKPALVKGLSGGKSFSVRTDYEVSESDAFSILADAMDEAGVKDVASVYYWLGVIRVIF